MLLFTSLLFHILTADFEVKYAHKIKINKPSILYKQLYLKHSDVIKQKIKLMYMIHALILIILINWIQRDRQTPHRHKDRETIWLLGL